MRAPLKCWSCGAENDLDTAQTCRACGAPLVRSRALFSKPVLIGIVVGFLVLQAFCILGRFPRP
jgi:zinc-ribbon domain